MRNSCQSFSVRRRSFPLARLHVGILGLALTTFRAFRANLFLNLGIRLVRCLPHFLPRVLKDSHQDGWFESCYVEHSSQARFCV